MIAETYANLGWVWEGGGVARSAPRSGDPVIGESADRKTKSNPTPDELCKPFRFLIGVQGEGGIAGFADIGKAKAHRGGAEARRNPKSEQRGIP
jgi:hypothetical protein